MKYNSFSFSFILIFTFSFINWSCSKSDNFSSLNGRYKTATKQTFGSLVMTTKAGVINDQDFIQNFLNREGVTYFKSRGASETLTSIKLNFNNEGAIINRDPSITDTAVFKVKEDNFVLLQYQRNGYFPPSPQYYNTCDIIADKVNKFPLTGSCETTGLNIICHHDEYYPIEISNNGISITPFNYFVKSLRSSGTGNYAIMCSRGEGNILSVVNSEFGSSLLPGDTVVVQKTFIALTKD